MRQTSTENGGPEFSTIFLLTWFVYTIRGVLITGKPRIGQGLQNRPKSCLYHLNIRVFFLTPENNNIFQRYFRNRWFQNNQQTPAFLHALGKRSEPKENCYAQLTGRQTTIICRGEHVAGKPQKARLKPRKMALAFAQIRVQPQIFFTKLVGKNFIGLF